MFIFKYWQQFYSYSGRKLWAILALSPMIGLLDGIGLTLLIPLVIGRLKESQTEVEPIDPIFQYIGIEPSFYAILVLVIGIIIFKSIVKYVRLLLSAQVSASFIQNVRARIVALIPGMRYRHYVEVKTGHMLNSATSDVFKYSTTQRVFIESISLFFVLTGYFVILIYNSWQISLVLFITGILMNFLYRWLNSRAKGLSRHMVGFNKEFNAKLIESVSYLKYLKATFQFRYFGNKLTQIIKNFSHYQKKTTLVNGLPNIIQEPVVLLMVGILISVNLWLINEPTSTLIIVLAVGYRASGILSQFQSKIQMFYSGMGSMESVNNLIGELKENQDDFDNETEFNFSEFIHLKNIHFGYGKKKVLKSIDFSIKKYSTIALVGPSGAGKSTIADIIAGLLAPDSGEIILDSVLHKNLISTSWHKKIGYVTQENLVFDGSVIENICLSDQYEDDKFWNALKLAYADEFVLALPELENTILGERGIKLSGGQRQRIAIARELYRNPQVLILDEATSALDGESEKWIKYSIDSLYGKTTLLIIAHRLSTIRNADRIIFISDGKIKDSGTYEQLLESSVMFQDLIKSQQ